MADAALAYKAAKEAFVSNLNGTSLTEGILSCRTVSPHGSIPSWSRCGVVQYTTSSRSNDLVRGVADPQYAASLGLQLLSIEFVTVIWRRYCVRH